MNNEYKMLEIEIRTIKDFSLELIENIKKLEIENLGSDAAINEWQIPVMIRYGKLIVAELKKNGKITGVCEILREWKEDRIAFIHSFYVCTGYRMQGIGKKLLKGALDILRDENFRQVELTVDAENKAAVKLYEDFGFEVKEVRTNEYGLGVDRNLMVLKF
ncbi:MAG: GNAT family N-acetyltransferase [Actinobacteria bacterium]|nr:GNAT family N-acetyltransferase [Actinomycetota bacterium]